MKNNYTENKKNGQKKPDEYVKSSSRLNDSEFYGTNSEKFGQVPDEPKISE
ncbi:hypothetical protein [Domibacillus indicus]|uniref:hypothetical protein n=1 Tax=Domibacillus indicus TaxID=1437523 RepID=UPI000A4F95F9|nr:hypothetical protein [Domibacillus indicus]